MSRSPDPALDPPTRRLGRYELFERIASGGMAAVYLGRALGSGGFERVVAIKICHDHLRENDDFVKMFLDEARLAAKIHHPNVVPTLDASDEDGLYLVMDFVEGGPLLSVIRAALQHGEPVPAPIALRIITDTLSGLHAAHELTDGAGSPYNIVHRDVSPPNILVGLDGITRIADFGVAKAAARATETRDGQLKGKIPYMAPEQFEGNATRQTDVFSAGVVLWETLVGKRLFNGKNDVETMRNVLMTTPAAPSTVWPGVPEALDPVVLRALHKDPTQRFASAAAFADALEATGVPIASTRAVTAYLTKMLGPEIETRRGHYRQFMRADVVLATPAPSSGVTQRKMSEALAELQSSPGFSPPASQAPKAPAAGSEGKPPIEAAPEKTSVPRPGALRAPTKPPVPAATPTASAPAAEKSAPAAAKPPAASTPSPLSAPSVPKPATVTAKPSTAGAAATATTTPGIAVPTSTQVEPKPKGVTAPTASPTPATNALPSASPAPAKAGTSSPLPARTAKSTLIGFAGVAPTSKPAAPPGAIAAPPSAPNASAEKHDVAVETPAVASPVPTMAPAPTVAPTISAPTTPAAAALPTPAPSADIATAVSVAAVPVTAPPVGASAPAPTSDVPNAAPPERAIAPTIATAPAAAHSSVIDDDEPIVLPTHGFGRREWIAGGVVLVALVGIAVAIGFRRGSNDAQLPPPAVVASAPSPHVEAHAPAPTPPVTPVADPIAPAVIAAAPVRPTPTPTVAMPAPTPTPAFAARPPTAPTVATAPARPIATPHPAPTAPPVVNPPTTPTHSAIVRTNQATATAPAAAATPARPRGGLRPRPTTGHGYVPDDI